MSQNSPLSRLIGGRYQLLSRIARGGMAEVWLADDTFVGRQVAVKLLKPHLANDKSVSERFRREALACAGISHPNIVAVFDCIEHDGQQAVIMQLVHGKSLREVLDHRQRLEPQLTMHIGISVAAALQEAHARGLVHRDVKPGNILLTSQAGCLLTDFGIAKALVSSGDDLTNDNIMMGTAKYLSPEQVRGKPLDGRADLYSLGLVLYECLAGRVPFVRETDADTALARLQREPTDLTRLRPALAPSLVKIIHKLLSRNPEHRYATAAETIAALIAARSGELDKTTELTPPAGLLVVGGEMLDESHDHRHRTIHPLPTSRPIKPPHTRGGVAGEPLVGAVNRERYIDPLSAPRNSNRTSTSSRSILLIVTGALVAALVGVSIVWSARNQTSTPGVVEQVAPTAAATAAITSVFSFDPNGDDGEENEALLPLLLDNNPKTSWSTTCYASQYFGSKEFVGIIVQLSQAATGTLNIYMGNAPWKMDVYSATDSAPSQLIEWGQPVATGYNTKRKGANFAVSEPAQFLLIVLREVGSSQLCSSTNPFQGVLSGVTFQPS